MHGLFCVANYYWWMLPQCTHILAPLSSKLEKKTYCWTPETDFAFKCMTELVAQDCLLAYLDHNKPFHIYTVDSSYHMGAYIVQDDKPMAFWSCKLNDAQLKYIVGDIELLSIVMVLMEFWTMLLGAILHIHTLVEKIRISDFSKFRGTNTDMQHIQTYIEKSWTVLNLRKKETYFWACFFILFMWCSHLVPKNLKM